MRSAFALSVPVPLSIPMYRGQPDRRLQSVKIPDSWLPVGGGLGVSWLTGWFLLRSTLAKTKLENEAKAKELEVRSRELDIRKQELDQKRVSDDNLLAEQIRTALASERKHLEEQHKELGETLKAQNTKIAEQTKNILDLQEQIRSLTTTMMRHQEGEKRFQEDCKRLAKDLALERQKTKKHEAEKAAWIEEKTGLNAQIETLFRSNELHEVEARRVKIASQDKDEPPPPVYRIALVDAPPPIETSQEER